MSGQAIPPHGTYSPPAAAAAYRMALAIMAAELEAPELEAIALEVRWRTTDRRAFCSDLCRNYNHRRIRRMHKRREARS